MPVLHPFLTSRLARWKEMERRLEEYLTKNDIWFAPLEDIAAQRHCSSGKNKQRYDSGCQYRRTKRRTRALALNRFKKAPIHGLQPHRNC